MATTSRGGRRSVAHRASGAATVGQGQRVGLLRFERDPVRRSSPPTARRDSRRSRADASHPMPYIDVGLGCRWRGTARTRGACALPLGRGQRTARSDWATPAPQPSAHSNKPQLHVTRHPVRHRVVVRTRVFAWRGDSSPGVGPASYLYRVPVPCSYVPHISSVRLIEHYRTFPDHRDVS